ncbi:MAG: DUF5615 family PIN-like protein [Pseudonocardia sp.]
MKLLVDQNLPRRLGALLQVEGHDALHTEQEVGLPQLIR